MKKLLKFSAGWCGPCKMLSKIMEGQDIGVQVEEIDIDENSELAAKYGIRGVPTLIVIEDGVEINRKTGMMQLQQIKEFVSASS